MLFLTFDDVSNIMVDRSKTNLAAVIWALLRSSFKSFCLSPVISYNRLAIQPWRIQRWSCAQWQTSSFLHHHRRYSRADNNHVHQKLNDFCRLSFTSSSGRVAANEIINSRIKVLLPNSAFPTDFALSSNIGFKNFSNKLEDFIWRKLNIFVSRRRVFPTKQNLCYDWNFHFSNLKFLNTKDIYIKFNVLLSNWSRWKIIWFSFQIKFKLKFAEKF